MPNRITIIKKYEIEYCRVEQENPCAPLDNWYSFIGSSKNLK